MEDVLDLYHRPQAPTTPVVCVDETSKQHIKEIRDPLRVVQGTPSRYDAEYQRNGVSNLFMIFAPLGGFRHVEVTDQRTSIDFAHICRDLVDVHFPEAEKILLVCDNLIVDSENKFTFSEIYVSIYDYGIFNRFTQTRA